MTSRKFWLFYDSFIGCIVSWGWFSNATSRHCKSSSHLLLWIYPEFEFNFLARTLNCTSNIILLTWPYRTTIGALAAFLDTFQKIADSASNTNGNICSLSNLMSLCKGSTRAASTSQVCQEPKPSITTAQSILHAVLTENQACSVRNEDWSEHFGSRKTISCSWWIDGAALKWDTVRTPCASPLLYISWFYWVGELTVNSHFSVRWQCSFYVKVCYNDRAENELSE